MRPMILIILSLLTFSSKTSIAQTSLDGQFEQTGTSADVFLQTSFEMGQMMNEFNGNYYNMTMFLYQMLEDPSSVIGKDVASVIADINASGEVPASIGVDILKDMMKSKSSALKKIKDATVKNNLNQFVKDIELMNTELPQMIVTVPTLITEGANLPDQLKSELTGKKNKAKLKAALDRVAAENGNLEVISAEAPMLSTNCIEISKLLASLLSKLGSK